MTPEKKERNKKIKTFRVKGWSYRKIGKHFKLNHKTVYEIANR